MREDESKVAYNPKDTLASLKNIIKDNIKTKDERKLSSIIEGWFKAVGMMINHSESNCTEQTTETYSF